MKKFTITKENLLKWYFEDLYNHESEEIKLKIAEDVIKQLLYIGKAKVTAKDIWHMINQGAIEMFYLEEYDETLHEDQTLETYGRSYKLKLINNKK